MVDLLFEGFRRITESALETQRDLLRHWSQQWVGIPLGTASRSTDWYRSVQRHWFELTISTLHKNREALDTAYRSSIEMLEQLFEAAEARSTKDAFKTVE